MPNAFSNPVAGRILAFGQDRTAATEGLFRVTQTFDHVNTSVSQAKHGAIDIANHRCNDSVFAAASGRARTMVDSAGAKAVVIDHGDGWISMYWHLNAWKIPTGTTVSVKAGTLIGIVGNTGISVGCHLHFELHYKGVKIDPWQHLAQNGAVNVSEGTDVKIKGVFIEHIINKKTVIRTSNKTGAWVHDAPSTSKESRLQLFADGTIVMPTVHVKGEVVAGSDKWYGGWGYINVTGWQFIYYHESVVAPLVDNVTTTGITKEQYDKDIAAARKSGKEAVAAAADAEAMRP